MTAHVLIVDDEAQIRRFLRVNLEAQQYEVHEVSTGQDALNRAALLRPELIILDLGLPDMDGLEVVRRIREWSTTPIIILSVLNSDHHKVSALDAGADDYLTKPFSVEELLARVRVAQRHSIKSVSDPIIKAGRLTIDVAHHTVTRNDELIKLTPTEFALLKLLALNAGKVLTHKQILKEVWGPEYIEETHYLRVYFGQLRQKLEDNPTLPVLLLTEPGVGYRLVASR
jgi:two-component system KDP operon response regulator KdpE